MIKYTLDQAAEMVGISRKTLEDYYYCLKKAEKISKQFNLKCSWYKLIYEL